MGHLVAHSTADSGMTLFIDSVMRHHWSHPLDTAPTRASLSEHGTSSAARLGLAHGGCFWKEEREGEREGRRPLTEDLDPNRAVQPRTH